MRENSSLIDCINHIQEIALILNDIRDFYLGIENVSSESEFPNSLIKFVNNGMQHFLFTFSLSYHGLRNQLNFVQAEELLENLEELMGWEKEENKKAVALIQWNGLGNKYLQSEDYDNAIRCYEEAHKLNQQNLWIICNLINVFNQIGEIDLREKYIILAKNALLSFENNDLDKEVIDRNDEYQEILKKFSEKRKIINDLHKRNAKFQKIKMKSKDTLTILCNILQEIISAIRGKNSLILLDDLPDIIEILLEDYLEMLSLMSSLIYYILQYNTGSKEERRELITDLEEIIGFNTIIKYNSYIWNF